MKRIMTIMLAAATMMTAASAQQTERIDREEILTLYGDSVKTDSLYDFWNTYVQVHPKDEVAWRNLFDVSERKVSRYLFNTRDANASNQLRKQLNVVGRMEQAIPRTYTFYYCAFEGDYLPEDEEKEMEGHGVTPMFAHHDTYADSAIVALPANALADDYECWIQYLLPKCDSVRLKQLLTRYYESGQYPEEALQYHFNELQGMEEGGIYCGAHEADIIGKLILQQVLGIHQDKILYNEDAAITPEYMKDLFGRIGISFDDVWDKVHSMWQDETLTAILRHILDLTKRPVYVSAHNIWGLILGQGLSDDMKAYFYNEGLTMRYSTKPYDNMTVKRRNIEQRYRLEYLRMPFHPEVKDTRRFSSSSDAYAMNYIRLLHDQLPYYKQHNKERYQWLRDIFTDIINRLEKKNYDVDEFKAYLK